MPATVYFGFDSAGVAYPAANYAAAESSASAGDTIVAGYCDNKQGRVWTGGITIAKDIALQGLLDRQGITFVNNGANIITCGSSCTIRNLRFGMGAYGVLANNASYTIVVDRCAFVGTAFAVISYNSTLMTITSCYADGCYALAYFVAGAMAAKNCTAVNCQSAYNGGGLALKNCVAYGCVTDYYGAPGATSCAGTHASIGTNYVDLIANDPKFWRALSSGGASDPRIQAGSALAGNGVYDAAVTLDLYDRPYANPPSRGCFEAWAIPTELAADKVLTGNDFVILDGSTRVATCDKLYSAAEEAARNVGVAANKILVDNSIKILNVTTAGSAIAEAHTANEVLKSAASPGNWNDDNLKTEANFKINVKDGVVGGLAWTGELTAAGDPPAGSPTVTLANDQTGTSFTATIAGIETTEYRVLRYRQIMSTTWTMFPATAAQQLGNGTIQVTGLTSGGYEVEAFARNAAGYGPSSVPQYVWVQEGASAGPNVKAAIHALLSADNTLIASLATYRFATGAAKSPAIFTGRRIPDDASFPAVLVREQSSDDWGCRENNGASVSLDVQIVSVKAQSDKSLEDLAWRVRDIIHRRYPTLQGYACHMCVAEPPIQTTVDENYPAYTIRVMVRGIKA